MNCQNCGSSNLMSCPPTELCPIPEVYCNDCGVLVWYGKNVVEDLVDAERAFEELSVNG